MKRPPSFAVTLATILFPVVLMLLKALADIIWDSDATNRARIIFDFIGEPLVALFLAVVLASITFGYAVGFDSKAIADRIGAALPPIAGIILIVGAGGGFKQTLIGSGLGDSIGKAAQQLRRLGAAHRLPAGGGAPPRHRLGDGRDHDRSRAWSRRSRTDLRPPTSPCSRWRSARARCSCRTSTTPASGWSTRASGSPSGRRSRPGR